MLGRCDRTGTISLSGSGRCRERAKTCTVDTGGVEVLARAQAGAGEIKCWLATTSEERAAVQAQRFQVYQGHGYDRLRLRADRDAYNEIADYFLAVLPDRGAILLGSGRLIRGTPRAGFTFPAEQTFDFELPDEIAKTAVSERVEEARVVAWSAGGLVIGGLLT